MTKTSNESVMTTNRLEAFSDGVIAIIITIMVLEMKVPHGSEWANLAAIIPKFLTYIMSFVFVGIYWNNHHHLMTTSKSVDGAILWANLHLLFWLSIVPFVTGWMGENNFEQNTVILYTAVLIMCAIAYTVLTLAIVRHQGPDSKLRRAIGRDLKGKASIGLYAVAIVSAFVNPLIAIIICNVVSIIWLIPDKRLESRQ